MHLSKIKINLKDPKTLLSILLQLSIVFLSVAAPIMYPNKANASVTEGFVRFDRLATGSAINGTACLKSDQTTQTGVTIVFPQGWTINSTASNWVASTTNIVAQEKDPVGGAAAEIWPGIGGSTAATSVTGLSVTWPTTSFTSGHYYCFSFTGGTAVQSTVGSVGNDKTGTLRTQGGNPFTDIMPFATSVVAAAADQIVVSASVSAQMTFSLGLTSVSFPTMVSPTVYSSSAITQTVITNARNGWVSWVKSTNGHLTSPSLGSTIDAGSYVTTAANLVDLSSATGYVLDADTGTGAPTIAAEYNSVVAVTGTTGGGGKLATYFAKTASNTGPTATDTVTYYVRAKVSATQAAANDYADTLTVTAAGSF